MRAFHRELVAHFKRIFEFQVIINSIELSNDKRELVESEIDIAIKTMDENYHGAIESDAVPILNSLRSHNANFYDDTKYCTIFIHYICEQYFRTKKMREVIKSIPTPKGVFPGHDRERTIAVELHMYAANVATSLFLDRKTTQSGFWSMTQTFNLLPLINL